MTDCLTRPRGTHHCSSLSVVARSLHCVLRARAGHTVCKSLCVYTSSCIHSFAPPSLMGNYLAMPACHAPRRLPYRHARMLLALCARVRLYMMIRQLLCTRLFIWLPLRESLLPASPSRTRHRICVLWYSRTTSSCALCVTFSRLQITTSSFSHALPCATGSVACCLSSFRSAYTRPSHRCLLLRASAVHNHFKRRRAFWIALLLVVTAFMRVPKSALRHVANTFSTPPLVHHAAMFAASRCIVTAHPRPL